MIFRILAIFFLFLFFSTDSNSQINKPEEKKNEWYVRISPQFWFINLKGEIINPPYEPVPSNPIEPESRKEIDVSFGELKSSIKFAFMGSGQYVRNRMIARFNLTSFIIAGDAITPFDLVLQDIYLKLSYLSGDVGFGYDFLNESKLNLYAIGGLKFVHFKIGGETKLLGEIPLEGARSKWYLDPVVGFYVDYRPFKWLELNGYGDIGLIFGEQNTTQIFAEANFFITHWFYLSGGYRYWYVEIPKDEAIYNGSISGYVVKLGFQIH